MMADRVGPRALADPALREDVIRHTSFAFRSSWTKLDEAAEGQLQIRPPEGAEEALRRDYEAMSGMIMGEAPAFDWVLSRVCEIADLYDSIDTRTRH